MPDHDARQPQHSIAHKQRRHSLLSPNAHGHSDKVDRALEQSEEGIRAVKLSLVALFVTATLQIAVVVASGSVALFADGLHNIADALTAVPLWIAFVVGRRPPSRRYTYGYGRAEDIAGIFIVATIAISAIVAAYEVMQRFLVPRDVHNLPLVALAALVGFLGNELVATYRLRVGKKIGSAALVADALHARTDGITSLGVLAGAIGVALGIPLADPLAGLAITVAILVVLWSAARDIFYRLMDAVDPELLDAIEHSLGHVKGIKAVVTSRFAGSVIGFARRLRSPLVVTSRQYKHTTSL